MRLYGERIRSAPGHFPSSFVEMRCFGDYNSHCIPAILFRLMESAGEQTEKYRDSPVYGSLMRLFPAENDRNRVEICVIEVKNREVDQLKLTQNLGFLANVLNNSHKLSPNNPVTFRSLCDIGNFSLNLLGAELKVNFPSVEIAIFQHNQVLFVLYTEFTWNSFVDFDCGHFELKYECYRKLRERVGNQARSLSELRNLSLECYCGCPLTLSSLPFPNRVFSIFSLPNHCHICQKPFEKVSISPLCRNHHLCTACGFKNFMSANYSRTPCCNESLTDTDLLLFLDSIQEEKWVLRFMEMLKHYNKLQHMKAYFITCSECRYSKIPRNSGNMCANCIEKAGKRLEIRRYASRIEKKKQENEGRCRTCNVEITPENQHFHPCKCDTCLIEAVISPEKQPKCVLCNEPYSQELVKTLKEAYERCHSCGIAVSKVEIETKLSCRPCTRCVTAKKRPKFLVFSDLIGSCKACLNGEDCVLDETNYEAVMESESQTACCANGTQTETRLECGHYVCAAHLKRLTRCRALNDGVQR